MKKVKCSILFILFFTTAIGSYAQTEPNNIRKLNNFGANASIQIMKGICILTKENETDTITVSTNKDDLLYLLNNKDSSKIKIFGFSAEQKKELEDQYNKDFNGKLKGLPLLQILVNRAADLGGTIKFVNNTEIVNQVNTNTIVSNETEFEDPSLQKKEGSNTLLFLGIGLGSLLLGLLLGKLAGGTKDKNTKAPATNLDEVNTNLLQERNTNTQLRQQIHTLQTEFNKVQMEDAAYFESVHSSLVMPFKNALAKNSQAEVLALAIQIATQMTAVTSHKTNRKQGSDAYNFLSISGANTAEEKSKLKVITKTSTADSIPNEWKTLFQICEKAGVQVPSGLSFMGFIFQ